MPFVVGETIGPYRILEQLGRGGMATVFKAYHASLDRYVAIKALHPAFMEDPNFHARFQREARVVAKLEHPNIVPIYDFAEYEDRPYLVMKYIEGETLKARLGQGNFEQAELIQIVESIGTGLFYAHQQGILHRDVKPSNVLLGFDERVYLADFGLARIAQAGESTISSDMMLGTPQYISPEQAMGLGELDERTDIYSFGVMLYEMAVGKVPFSADTPFSIIHDHIYTPLPLPRTVNPSVPESVELVLLKALAKEREDRYPDANALAKAFTQAVQSEPDAAPVVIAPEPDRTYVPAPELEREPQVAESISSVAEVETAVPAIMGAVDETPAQEIDEVQPVDDAPASYTKKRRFRWWFLPLGIIIIAACCFCGFIALNNFEDFPDRDKPAAEQLPEGIFPEEHDSSTYEDAQSWVDEAPEDPYAWLSLAEAHSVAQHHEEAWGALNRALELAKDDADFYFDTAEELADRGFWVEAAQIYLRGFQGFHNGEIPDEMLDDFHEAVYWATDSPEAEHIVPIPEIAKVDIPMERVATARILFHFGDEEEALKILERVLIDIKPDMPEALYLQSEIFYAWGDVEAYFNILRELQAREDTPDWIREDIEFLLHESIQMREQAQAQVDANPENPYVYLPLYEWYLGVGLYQEANDVIQLALKIAGDDPEIAQLAGEIATRYGAWLDAAQLFAYAGQLEPGELPPELVEIILQALYYGAVEEGAPEIFGELETYLPEGERGILRAAYRDALMARYKLYYEDADEAKAIIEDVVGRMPKTLALPRLVQAEVYLFTDDIRQGEAILLELKNSRTAPPWVQDEVQFMLEAIKPDL